MTEPATVTCHHGRWRFHLSNILNSMDARGREERDSLRGREEPDRLSADLVVIGAGPAGSAGAAWAAREGRDVLVIDAADFPRDKPCGDGLTPRAVAELQPRGPPGWLTAHTQ